MKVILVAFALYGLAIAAPEPKKLFHEHFEDFMDIIGEEAGHDIEHIASHYLEYEEFVASMDYLLTNNFKMLVYEMEHLPEFEAVVSFLESNKIDINYFLDQINNMLANINRARGSRHGTSGRDFNSFIDDCIGLFPKEKLAALYDQKIAEDDDFRTAMENLRSEEWDVLFSALWESRVFQVEKQTLAENGIDLGILLRELMAVFGQ